jgi:OmpA-OmpF porin, OOP family
VRRAVLERKTITRSVFSVLALTTTVRVAHADEPLRAHATLGVAHAVGAPQYREFGLGGAGSASLELPLGRALGVEGKLGAIILAEGDPPRDPAFAKQGTGTLFFGTAGLRVHPFTAAAGPWASAGFGFAQTGSRTRPGLDLAVGWDFRVGREGRWDVGPYAGYTQVIQPDDALRPSDARIVSLGIQVGLGAKARPRSDRDEDSVFDDEDACPDVAGIRTSDPKTNGCPRGDRDHDTVFDDEDACPDSPGVRTSDPKTNGCPGDRDKDTVLDHEDACPDEPGVRTNDSKTNGCPPSDRDQDGVLDAEDACPDVSGVRTPDPSTNGCPPATDTIHVENDRILFDEVILFDLDSPRVRHASWGIIRKLAEFINATPQIVEISIEGHADATGTERHNLVLSRERAESVRRLLVRFGVDEARVKAEAFGRSRLKVQTRRAEAANRRVEFWITRTRTGPAGTSQQLAPAGQDAR